MYTNTVGRTTNHSWCIALQWSYDFKNWFPTTPANVFTPIIANGPSIPTEYTTTTNFGLGLRLSLYAANSSGSANENAFVSATAALRFKT